LMPPSHSELATPSDLPAMSASPTTALPSTPPTRAAVPVSAKASATTRAGEKTGAETRRVAEPEDGVSRAARVARSVLPASAPPASAPVRAVVRSAVERETVRLTNAERAKAGCARLRTDSRLVEAARGHTADMADRNRLSHTSVDGATFVDRARAAGYPSPGGENIAWGQPTASAVLEDWIDSPGHRENIRNCDFTAIGAGFDPGRNYWTQVFGY